jgi:ElaB/YqjD/DUF883 family membrane-anchored ribosome-binding protein
MKTTNPMNTSKEIINGDLVTLVEDARNLLNATADTAGEKVGEARKRLAAALEGSGRLCSRVRDKAVEGAEFADQTVRENPYQAVGLAVGVGALIGYLLARR